LHRPALCSAIYAPARAKTPRLRRLDHRLPACCSLHLERSLPSSLSLRAASAFARASASKTVWSGPAPCRSTGRPGDNERSRTGPTSPPADRGRHHRRSCRANSPARTASALSRAIRRPSPPLSLLGTIRFPWSDARCHESWRTDIAENDKLLQRLMVDQRAEHLARLAEGASAEIHLANVRQRPKFGQFPRCFSNIL
jgi:hypothetical protein